MKALVKSNFVLVTDDCRRFEFEAGEQDIPAEIADHWYVKAHVEAYDVPAVEEAPQPKRKAK